MMEAMRALRTWNHDLAGHSGRGVHLWVALKTSGRTVATSTKHEQSQTMKTGVVLHLAPKHEKRGLQQYYQSSMMWP